MVSSENEIGKRGVGNEKEVAVEGRTMIIWLYIFAKYLKDYSITEEEGGGRGAIYTQAHISIIQVVWLLALLR